VPGLPTQPLDERGRGVEGEADEVDDRVGSKVGYPVREGARAVLDLSIRGHVTHLLPGGVVDVAGSLSTADADDVVTGADQSGDQKRTDVAASTDDNDSHDVRLTQPTRHDPDGRTLKPTPPGG
jgi:hypothetical protein